MAREEYDPKEQRSDFSKRQAYNLVTDTVAGPNIRLRDNIIQALVILVCLLAGVGVGASLMDDWRAGLLVGAFAGLLVGFFGSGIFLMVFRAANHLRGRHD